VTVSGKNAVVDAQKQGLES